MEKWAGANTDINKRPFTRLPIKLFTNYGLNGSLFEILNYLFKYKYDRNKIIRKNSNSNSHSNSTNSNNNNNGNTNNSYFNFKFLSNLSDLNKHVNKEFINDNEKNFSNIFNSLFNNLINYLKQLKLIEPFRIYISNKISRESQLLLSQIIIKHGGIVSNVYNSSITHIIHRNTEELLTIDSNNIETKEISHDTKSCKIHFPCFPESYDTWVPMNGITNSSINNDDSHHGRGTVWNVVKYNYILLYSLFRYFVCFVVFIVL